MPGRTTAAPGSSSSVYVVAGVAALGGLLFGYDTGIISGPLLFIREEFQLSDTMQQVVVAPLLLGAIFGARGGGAAMVVPIYIAEASPSNVRESLVRCTNAIPPSPSRV